MKKRAPFILLACFYLFFFATVLMTANDLPNPMASHFNGRGNPDNWTDRSSYLLFMVGLAILLPGVVVGLCYAIRFMPDSLINLPRREYWLAPSRRHETFDHVFRQSIWFGCLAIAFVIGIHLIVLEANAQVPVRLSAPLLIGLAGCFVIGVVGWSVRLIWRFLRAERASEASE
jgi:hypothetical protein